MNGLEVIERGLSWVRAWLEQCRGTRRSPEPVVPSRVPSADEGGLQVPGNACNDGRGVVVGAVLPRRVSGFVDTHQRVVPAELEEITSAEGRSRISRAHPEQCRGHIRLLAPRWSRDRKPKIKKKVYYLTLR